MELSDHQALLYISYRANRIICYKLVEEDDEDSSFTQLMKDKIAHFQLLKEKVLVELELYELV